MGALSPIERLVGMSARYAKMLGTHVRQVDLSRSQAMASWWPWRKPVLPFAPPTDAPVQAAASLAFRVVGAYLAVGMTFVLMVTHGAPFVPNPDSHWQVSMSEIATFLIVTGSLVFLLSRFWFQELIAARHEVARAKIELVHRLAVVAEWKDDTIGGHNYRIARSAQIIASRLGLPDHAQRLIYHGAVMHDIGKVGMPDYLLRKNGSFTADERKLMERHVLLGAALLEGSGDELLGVARTIALTHHENWDGSGYPSGLSGKGIPIEGRIVAVCDVLDALLSRRPYKEAWADSDAIDFIRAESGRKFDPDIVEAMLASMPEIAAVRTEVPNDPWVARHADLAVRSGLGLIDA